MVKSIISRVLGNSALKIEQNEATDQLSDEQCALIRRVLAPKMTLEQKAMIAQLNDQARADIPNKCRVITSDAFAAEWHDQQGVILDMISRYNAFDPGITLFEERDFGVVFRLNDGSWSNQTPSRDWSQQSVYWLFEYSDPTYSRPSTAPWDTSKSARSLLLMLPHEYI